MKAYKVFNNDWACRGFQYEVGETYEMKEKPVLCEVGFHACKKAVDCFNYYSFDTDNKVAEVELIGDIVGTDKDKQATNKIKIVREVEWAELLGLINTGSGNSGNRNSGDRNSGNSNSGDSNSGNSNSGYSNSGYSNSGNSNSGNSNSGNSNSGNSNSGNSNSGDSNSGYRNSGYSNSGDSNSGNSNSGYSNSGYRNSGNRNSGNWNSGNWNSGNWNSGNWNSGFFNTENPIARLFNKDTELEMGSISFPSFLYFDLTQWVSHDTATEEEKEEYKNEIETCGGFLRTLDYKTAFERAWDNASVKDKETVKNLPNFDAEIFYEISGIKID